MTRAADIAELSMMGNHASWLALVNIAVVLVQFGLFLSARRSSSCRPDGRLTLLVLLLPLAPVIATLCSVHLCRADMIRYGGAVESMPGDPLWHAVVGEFSALVVGLAPVPLAVFTGAVVAAWQASVFSGRKVVRPVASGSRALGPIIFVCYAGLLPIVGAAAWSGAAMLDLLASQHELPFNEKRSVLQQGLLDAGSVLDGGLLAGGCGTVFASALALGVMWPRRGGGDRLVRGTSPSRIEAVSVVACGAAVAVLLTVAEPMARENAKPWPSGDIRPRLRIATPPHPGPELARDDLPLVPLGPVLELTANGAAVDRSFGRNLSELADRFRWAARAFVVLHPESEFDGTFVLICGTGAEMSSSRRALHAAYAAGYRRPILTSEERVRIKRPFLGVHSWYRISTARLLLLHATEPLPGNVVPVPLARLHSCEELANRVAQERYHGREVGLQLGDDGLP